MKIAQQISCSHSISSIAFSADGDILAVAVGMSLPYALRSPDAPCDPQILLYRLSNGQLHQYDTLRLRPDAEAQVKWEDGKVTFLDEWTLLVAARNVRSVTDQDVVLIALDLPTGQERGRWTCPGFFERILSDLIPVPPRHALLSLSNTVVCVDMETFQEVCSAREIKDGEVAEEDAVPEETLAPNGFAYDPAASTAHLLCRNYSEAILLRCRLDLSARAFLRESRHQFPERQDHVGLCPTPGGGLTLLFQMADVLVDLDGSPIVIWNEEVRRELLTRARTSSPPPPSMVPLGLLRFFLNDMQTVPKEITFQSEFARDFSAEPYETTDDDGRPVQVGYRYSSGDVRLTLAHGDFLTKPIYLDDHRVVLGTPSGFLLCIDTATDQSEVVYDFHSRINSLQFLSGRRLLLAGCENGLLSMLAV